MDTRRIRKLIELVKETGIGELEVKSGDDSVKISCYSSGAPQQAQAHVAYQHPSPTDVAADMPSSASGQSVAPETGHTVASPMVGTVYLAPSPGAKPFVAVGDSIEVGDTLCMIEAMKMFNKIEAEVAGVVSARLIENDQPVEYNQSLFIIEPSE